MIECSDCGNNVWCCWDDGQYICKDCYLQEGHTYTDWQELNQENKEYREKKRREKAEQEFEDL